MSAPWCDTAGSRKLPLYQFDAKYKIVGATLKYSPNMITHSYKLLCSANIKRGALAKRARRDRVSLHPRALETRSYPHIWHGGSLSPG